LAVPLRTVDDVEYATLEWVGWFNNRRPLEPIGNISPAKFEVQYYEQIEGAAMVARLKQNTLRNIRGGSNQGRY
jgi:hypothetical protein